MASNNPYDNPDLSAVLKTLSAFSNPSAAAAASQYQQPQQKQPPKTISPQDPSNITTWPPALKHIMRLISQNEEICTQIRRLVQTQHDHEKQWWAGREALIAKQKGRGEKKRQLEEVLKSVGAAIVTPADDNSKTNNNAKQQISAEEEKEEKENTIELNYYDAKVHKASVDMSRSMETELRRLGVPFFSIKESLVLSSSSSSSSTTPGEKTRGKKIGEQNDGSQISSDELVALKKRMVELLQDLCKD